MNSNSKTRNYTLRYIVVTYVVFWLGILLLGGIYLLTKSDLFMNIAIVLLSWTPTFVLLIMFKKLIPNKTRKNYIKELFSQKINIKIILTTAIAFIFSILLTYLGQKLNVDIYLAAIVVFVGRMFNNLAIIRRYYLDKLIKYSNIKNIKKEQKEEAQ